MGESFRLKVCLSELFLRQMDGRFGKEDLNKWTVRFGKDDIPSVTYLLRGSERLPPGGDVLTDLPEHGPGASDRGHVSLSRRLEGMNILLKIELNTM